MRDVELVAATGKHSASWAMPALPGAKKSSSGRVAVFRRAQTSACSRPPEPIVRIRIVRRALPFDRLDSEVKNAISETQRSKVANSRFVQRRKMLDTS